MATDLTTIGTRVQLVSLNAAAYNGKCGTVVAVRDDGRVGVRLDRSGAVLAIKPCNVIAAPLGISDITFTVQLLHASKFRQAGTVTLEPLGVPTFGRVKSTGALIMTGGAIVKASWEGHFPNAAALTMLVNDASAKRGVDASPRLWAAGGADEAASWYDKMLTDETRLDEVRMRVSATRPDGRRVTLFEGEVADGGEDYTIFGGSETGSPWSLPSALPELDESELPTRRGLHDVRLSVVLMHDHAGWSRHVSRRAGTVAQAGQVRLELFTWDEEATIDPLAPLRPSELEKYVRECLPWDTPDASTRGEAVFPDQELSRRVLEAPDLLEALLKAMAHPIAVGQLAAVNRMWASSARDVLRAWQKLVQVGSFTGERRAKAKSGTKFCLGDAPCVVSLGNGSIAVSSGESFALGYVYVLRVPATTTAFTATFKSHLQMRQCVVERSATSGLPLSLASDLRLRIGKECTAAEANGESTGPNRPNRLPRPREGVGELMCPVGLAHDGTTLWVTDTKRRGRIVAFRLVDGAPTAHLGGDEEFGGTPWLSDGGEGAPRIQGLALVNDILVGCAGDHLVALSKQLEPLFRSTEAEIKLDCSVEAGGLAAHGNFVFITDDGQECVHVVAVDREARTFRAVRKIDVVGARGVAVDASFVYVSVTDEEDDLLTVRVEVLTHTGELLQRVPLALPEGSREFVAQGIGLAISDGHLYVPVGVDSPRRLMVHMVMVLSLWGGLPTKGEQ